MNIEELERLRKKARNTLLAGVIVSIIVSVICIFTSEFSSFFIVVVIVGIFVTTLISNGPRRKFILAYKEAFVLAALKTVFTDLVYHPDMGLSEGVIRNTGMMYMGDRFSSNDYLTGKYKGINVEQADIKIEEKHRTVDSNGHIHTTWITIFQGRWLVFDFNKNFKANVQVSQKGFLNSKVSNWGSKLKYQKIEMEDQAFNNEFRTFAQDEHEAFYILTPALMEKIRGLTSNVSGKLLFCFVDNKLHIGVKNNKDSFEHSIFARVDPEKATDEISKDIKLITDFVNNLSLDNNLFKKGVI